MTTISEDEALGGLEVFAYLSNLQIFTFTSKKKKGNFDYVNKSASKLNQLFKLSCEWRVRMLSHTHKHKGMFFVQVA